jgi:hypothetical protein
MFCARYFGNRPFAPRYFPKVGATAAAVVLGPAAAERTWIVTRRSAWTLTRQSTWTPSRRRSMWKD